MKKTNVINFISGTLVGAILFSGVAYASSTVKLIVDGKQIQSDVQPQIINGRTMIPARYLAEALGATVQWDASNHTVIITSKGKLPRTAGPLTQQSAGSLVKNALDAYWHVMQGGQYPDGAALPTFQNNGTEYRWLGDDINTMQKLRAYLGQYYTEAVISSMIQKANIIEKNGKLAQVNADGGSLLNYNSPQVTEVKHTEQTAQYEFTFEIGETTEFKVVQLYFKTDMNGEWKVDTPPGDIYKSNSDPFVYQDPAFLVSLPQEWKEKIKVVKNNASTIFYYQPKDASKQLGFLFSIDQVPKSQWDSWGSDTGLHTLLTQRSGTVYALLKASENPYADKPDSVEYKEIQQMLLDLKKVIHFELNTRSES